jgi:hypothetical protein
VKSGLTVVVDRAAEFRRAIDLLGSQRVMVGIPSDKAGRSGGPINNAALGYIHNFGAPEVGIPPRPFLEPGVASIQPAIEAGLRKAADAAFEGNPGGVTSNFNAVGLKAQAAVRAKITDGPFVPLKPATLAARRRRGRTGTKPLIDTAQLRNAVSYVIRKVTG